MVELEKAKAGDTVIVRGELLSVGKSMLLARFSGAGTGGLWIDPEAILSITPASDHPDTGQSGFPMPDEWRLIDDLPDQPCMVMFYASKDADAIIGPNRDTAYELGFFDGKVFGFLYSGHDLFEWPDDKFDESKPTHWRPLPSPPKASEG